MMNRPRKNYRAYLNLILAGLYSIGLNSTLFIPSVYAAVNAPLTLLENLAVNPDFENGLDGWYGSGNSAVLTITEDGAFSGNYGARISPRDGKATITLNDKINTISPPDPALSPGHTSTIVGHTYEASAWVRPGKSALQIAVRLMEYTPQNQLAGQNITSKWVPAGEWTKLTVTYQAATTGSSLDFNVIAYQVAPGNYADIDAVLIGDYDSGRNWQHVWSDEFDGTELDPNVWSVEHRSTMGDGNEELACLMKENVQVKDGKLVITAKKQPPTKCKNKDQKFPKGRSYTSGFVQTKPSESTPGKQFTYGRFEISAKTPVAAGTSSGMWPAFWLRPVDLGIGEIDVMEQWGHRLDTTGYNTLFTTLHYDYKKSPTHNKSGRAYQLKKADFSQEFHQYALEWEPGVMRWYLDGVKVREVHQGDSKVWQDDEITWMTEAFSRPFFLRLNLAVSPTLVNWYTGPNDFTMFPQDYEIEYIRVYQREASLPIKMPELNPNMSWHMQLEGTLQKPERQLYDIDLFDTSAETIAGLKKQGRVVICYFSAGSWENWRQDAAQYPSALLGKKLDGWAGEKWVDIRNDALKPIMSARLDLAKQKGCDGVDPDNVDGYSNSTGFPLTRAQQRSFNSWLATESHARGLLVGLKNALELVEDLAVEFDFAVNEECFTYNECNMLRPFSQLAKPVFIAEYKTTSKAARCRQAKQEGFNLQFFKLALDRTGTECE